MKINKLFLVSLLLLTVITIGAVSATDTLQANGNETLSLDKDTNLQVNDEALINDKETSLQSADDVALGDDEKMDWEMETYTPEDHTIRGDKGRINFYSTPYDYDTELTVNDFNLTLNGERVEFEFNEENHIRFETSNMELGTYNYTLLFKGNEFYNPAISSGTINLVEYYVKIPDKYVYEDFDQNENIIVETNKRDIGKTVSVTISGKTIEHKVENQTYTEYEYYGYTYFDIKKFNLVCGNHSVVVKINGKKISEKTISIDYLLVIPGMIEYGNDILAIDCEDDIDLSKLSLKIAGIELKDFEKNEFGCIVKTTKDIPAGNQEVIITYAGDAKYPAKTFTTNIDVTPLIFPPDKERNNGTGFSVLMPDDAKGNLMIVIKAYDDPISEYKLFANVKAAGEILIPTSNLSYGHYEWDFQYTGDDYKGKIGSLFSTFYINPKLTFPPSNKIMLGEEAYIIVDLPGKTGKIEITEAQKYGRDTSVNLVDGKAKVLLPWIDTEGKHAYWITLYLGNESEDNFDGDIYDYEAYKIEVVNPITAKDTSIVYSANGNYKVNIKDINGKAVQSGKVTFYILDGSKQILKKSVDIKNGAATLTYKITQGVKTYKIKTVFNKASVTKKLTVKHVVTLKTIKVKKSAKKITLQANLAKVNGKYLVKKTVTFKFNGKTYKAKTDKKGVAKVTIKNTAYKNFKVGKKITYQATYMKDTVKKTVKVLK